MIAGVANQVHQRILDGLDDGPVELRLGSVHLQADLLAEGHRHVAHHPRQLVPDHPDGLHARLHDALLQFGGDQVQPLRSRVERGILALGVELEDLIAGQHQFSHQIHQLVEQSHADADVRVRHSGRLCRVLFRLRRSSTRRLLRGARASRLWPIRRPGLLRAGVRSDFQSDRDLLPRLLRLKPELCESRQPSPG